MRLSKISKKIVAVVSAIALVIAGISYAPATANAADYYSTNNNWVNITAEGYDNDGDKHYQVEGISGIYAGHWDAAIADVNLYPNFDDPYSMMIDVTNKNATNEWITQVAFNVQNLDATKVYTISLLYDGNAIYTASVDNATEYKHICNTSYDFTEGVHTLKVDVEEMVPPTGDVEVEDITITPDATQIANNGDIWANWTNPTGTAKAYAYLQSVDANNGVIAANGWNFNTQAGQPMAGVDHVIKTVDNSVEVKPGGTYKFIVEAFNAFGQKIGYGEVEITIPGGEPTTAEEVSTAVEPTTEEGPTVAPYDPGFDPADLDYDTMTSGDVSIGLAVKESAPGLVVSFEDAGKSLSMAYDATMVGIPTAVAVNGVQDTEAVVEAVYGLVKIDPTLLAENAYSVIDVTFENGDVMTFVVETGVPAEESTTEAPTGEVESTTEAPTGDVETTTEEDEGEFVPFGPNDLTDINEDNFEVTESTYDEQSGDVNAQWFAVGGWEVFVAYWNNVTASAAVEDGDEDHIAVQQHSSNWWDKWGFQVRKSISNLTPGEEYTMLVDLFAVGDSVKYYTSSAPDTEIIQPANGDYETIEIKATANEDGVATFNFAFGYVSLNAVADLSDPVIYDSEDNEVYPDDERETTAPVESTTEAPVESTTVAPTESATVAPTEAPSGDVTTAAPTQEVKTTVAPKKVAKPSKVKIKKIAKKKKSAKKLKVTLKKAKNAKGYQVAVYKSKKNAKKNKKAIVKKYSKSVKVKLKGKKLKGKKKLFVRARAYNLDGKKKVFGAWSKIKKVKVK